MHGNGSGIDRPAYHATDIEGGSTGYIFDHPIKTPEDVKRLRPQTWRFDRKLTSQRFEELKEMLNRVMPVVMHGTSGLHIGMTNNAFKLVGNDRMHMRPYDEPEALQESIAYLSNDRIRHHQWLKSNGLLGTNNNGTIVGSGSPGFVTGLPEFNPSGETRLKDFRVWCESQKTSAVSPRMLAEFFAAHGPCGQAVRSGLLWLLRRGSRPLGIHPQGDSQRAGRLDFTLMRHEGHRRTIGDRLCLLTQTSSRPYQRAKPQLGGP